MSLDLALSVASSGIALIDRQFALISQNVANADTPGYARETMSQQALTAGGRGMGAAAGPAQRDIDLQMQASVLGQTSTVADLQTRTASLSAIDAAMGTPGGGGDLPGLVGKLQDAFVTLSADPSSTAQQSAVVQAARALAGGINTLAQTTAAQRQSAQDALVKDVGSLNGALSTIGTLTTQIRSLAAQGISTADLENQRDAAMQTATGLLGVRFVPQAGGSLLAVAGGGQQIPLDGTAPFSVAQAMLSPGSPAGPGVMLNGVDVTQQLSGGSIGADISLRDQILPRFQATLDEFSDTLAHRFDAQGLTLFTDGTGNVPPATGTQQSGYVGLANTIQVNPGVVQTPSLVRDGTSGNAGAFTPNPTGAAGYGGLIDRVLSYTFGADAQPNVRQPVPTLSNIGPGGNLSAGFGTPATLSDFASSVVVSQATISGSAKSDLDQAQAVQTTLQGRLSDSAAVSVDSEMATMVQLQNAYSANARIVAATQSMWTQLLNMVGS